MGMTPLPIELLVPRDELRAQTAREGSLSGRRPGSLSSRQGSASGALSHRGGGEGFHTARDEYRRKGSARRPRTTGLPVSAPPLTSPYYGPPLALRSQLLSLGTAGAGGPSRSRTAASGESTPRVGNMATPRKKPWVSVRESDAVKLFDPNLNGRWGTPKTSPPHLSRFPPPLSLHHCFFDTALRHARVAITRAPCLPAIIRGITNM